MLFQENTPTLRHSRLLVIGLVGINLLALALVPWTAHKLWLIGLHLLALAGTALIYVRLNYWRRERCQLIEVANALADGFALYDHDDRLLLCNEAFAALYRTSPAELRGQTFTALLKQVYSHYHSIGHDESLSPQHREAFWQAWQQQFTDRRSYVFDIPSGNGRSYRVRNHFTPGGHRVIIRTEITDLKHKEALLDCREQELNARQILLQAMQEASPDGFVAVDANGQIIAHNQRFVQMWNIPLAWLATADRHVMGPYLDNQVIDASTIRQEIEQAYADPERAFQRETQLKDGRIFESHTAPLPESGSGTAGRVWFYRDITALRRLEQETHQRQERMQAAIDVLGDGFALFAADDKLLLCNEAFAAVYGSNPEALQGRHHDHILLRGYQRGLGLDTAGLPFERWLESMYIGRRQQPHRTLEVRAWDGRWFLVTERLTASNELVLVRTDISRQKQLELELRRLASTDSLTGALNHGYFMQQAAAEFKRSRRHGHPLTLLMLDADHFKHVNDTQGHAAGDEVLCQMVALLQQELRENDLLGRLGGEEFAVLLPETEAERGSAVAERLLQRLRNLRITGRAGTFGITISIGLAAYSRKDNNLEALLQRADAALYRAKDQGRNQLVNAD